MIINVEQRGGEGRGKRNQEVEGNKGTGEEVNKEGEEVEEERKRDGGGDGGGLGKFKRHYFPENLT